MFKAAGVCAAPADCRHGAGRHPAGGGGGGGAAPGGSCALCCCNIILALGFIP